MSEQLGGNTEAETTEMWDTWASTIALESPELAEEIVRGIIEVEGETDGTN